MRCLAPLLLALFLVGSIDSGVPHISFSTPALIEDAVVEHIQWIAYAAQPDTATKLVLQGGPGTWQQRVAIMADTDTGDVDIGAANLKEVTVEERSFERLQLEIAGNGVHALAVEAQDIVVTSPKIEIARVAAAGASIRSNELPGGNLVQWSHVPSENSVVVSTTARLGLNASGGLLLTVAGWEGLASLDGEERAIENRVISDQLDMPIVYYIYQLQIDQGRLEVHSSDGSKGTIMVADAPDIFAGGQVLLPRVHDHVSRGQLLQNGTLLIQGPGHFLDISVEDFETNRIRSNLSGDFVVLRQNGQLLDSKAVLPTAAGVGLLAAIAIAARMFGALGLFTRLSPQQALEHPRRQTLHKYIQDHPGATFRELCRATDIPAGTCRHHLSVLDRAQVIVEHRHRATVRFFENHGKFDGNWEEVVMLREPELAQIHGWLEEHEGVIQKDILEHALSAWGWSRSTTQHRLQRLVDNGLLEVQEMGRRKSYSLASNEPEPMRQFGLRV